MILYILQVQARWEGTNVGQCKICMSQSWDYLEAACNSSLCWTTRIVASEVQTLYRSLSAAVRRLFSICVCFAASNSTRLFTLKYSSSTCKVHSCQDPKIGLSGSNCTVSYMCLESSNLAARGVSFCTEIDALRHIAREDLGWSLRGLYSRSFTCRITQFRCLSSRWPQVSSQCMDSIFASTSITSRLSRNQMAPSSDQPESSLLVWMGPGFLNRRNVILNETPLKQR